MGSAVQRPLPGSRERRSVDPGKMRLRTRPRPRQTAPLPREMCAAARSDPRWRLQATAAQPRRGHSFEQPIECHPRWRGRWTAAWASATLTTELSMNARDEPRMMAIRIHLRSGGAQGGPAGAAPTCTQGGTTWDLGTAAAGIITASWMPAAGNNLHEITRHSATLANDHEEG